MSDERTRRGGVLRRTLSGDPTYRGGWLRQALSKPAPPAEPAPPAAHSTRPPQIPDLEPVMRSAIVSLRGRGIRLTWPNVATEIAATLDTSYSESTLRRNAKGAGLPHPTDPHWR